MTATEWVGPTIEEMNAREAILTELDRWVRQRPGLDWRNYVSSGNDTEGRRAYFAEVRSITTELHHARALLAFCWRHQSITATMLTEAFRAFSGRLSWHPEKKAGDRLEYCTGQYWPTEYRAAVCAVS